MRQHAQVMAAFGLLRAEPLPLPAGSMTPEPNWKITLSGPARQAVGVGYVKIGPTEAAAVISQKHQPGHELASAGARNQAPGLGQYGPCAGA